MHNDYRTKMAGAGTVGYSSLTEFRLRVTFMKKAGILSDSITDAVCYLLYTVFVKYFRTDWRYLCNSVLQNTQVLVFQ